MDYLDDFTSFNPKTKLDAKTYVDINFNRLVQLMNIEIEDYEDEDEIKNVLVEYFTRFPDRISSVNLQTFGVPKNYLLRLNNIGGTIKYL